MKKIIVNSIICLNPFIFTKLSLYLVVHRILISIVPDQEVRPSNRGRKEGAAYKVWHRIVLQPVYPQCFMAAQVASQFFIILLHYIWKVFQTLLVNRRLKQSNKLNIKKVTFFSIFYFTFQINLVTMKNKIKNIGLVLIFIQKLFPKLMSKSNVQMWHI